MVLRRNIIDEFNLSFFTGDTTANPMTTPKLPTVTKPPKTGKNGYFYEFKS